MSAMIFEREPGHPPELKRFVSLSWSCGRVAMRATTAESLRVDMPCA
jgi:hypothetical protein